MLRLLACAVLLSGCMVSAAGNGTSGNLSWAFTITNTLPSSAVPPGDGGLVVVVTYANGSTSRYKLKAGESLRIPANGIAATVSGGGAQMTVTPGTDLFWTGSGWSTSAPRPSGGG